MMRLAALLCLGLLSSSAATARAQGEPTDLPPGGTGAEPVDTTRLDVARLPPEAATITRDLFARGWFVEAQVGALAYAGDAKDVSRAGPRFAIAFGYELTRWLALLGQLEGSLHQTHNRPPPAHTSYELVGAAAGIRFAVPFATRYALWAEGVIGVAWSSRDVLRALDFLDADEPGVSYGGELGFDWHMKARHHSLGMLGGARHLPSLARADFTVAGYGALYLRYVF